jgi:excisionase family DNA binding protein
MFDSSVDMSANLAATRRSKIIRLRGGFSMSSGRKEDESRQADDRLLTVAEVAHFLNISPGTLYHMITQRRSTIPTIRISRRCVRFSRRALEAWTDSLAHVAERTKATKQAL